MFRFKKVLSKNAHQDDTYEVIQLESKSEAERRAKFQRLSSGKSFKIKKIFNKNKKIFFFFEKEFHLLVQVMRIMMKQL
jgi:hypothetical protein